MVRMALGRVWVGMWQGVRVAGWGARLGVRLAGGCVDYLALFGGAGVVRGVVCVPVRGGGGKGARVVRRADQTATRTVGG